MAYVKTMQSFGKLKGICTGLGGAYNPGQQHLQVKALTTIQFNAQQVMDEVTIAKTVYDNITNQRELAFRNVRQLGARILYLLRASGSHPLTLADAIAINRMLQGRLKNRAPEPRTASESEPEGEGSARRRARSFDYASQAQYFAQLVETATADPNYNPAEAELKAEALEQKVLEMRSLNELVMKAGQRLNQLRQKRKVLFYEGEHSLVNTARAARNYIRAVFGFKSAPHEELVNLSLTKPTA